MTEPQYEYIKGQGWVISNGYIVSTEFGNYKLEVRSPVEGELVICFWSDNDYYVKDGKVDLDTVAFQYKKCVDLIRAFQDDTYYKADQEAYERGEIDYYRVWVVWTKL